MKIRELFEYVDEVMENVFSDKVKLRWVNQIEAELQTNVLLLAANSIVQYSENDMEAELLAPPPFDELYTEYLQYRICLAQEEPERANNKAQTYNRIYTAYQIYIAQTVNPGNGMAEGMLYYLSAYSLAVKHGYTGSEIEWLAELQGKDGTGMTMEYDEESGMLIVTTTGSGGNGNTGGNTECVGIASVEQTQMSTADNGINIWKATLTNGDTSELRVRNGSIGKPGKNGVGVDDMWYEAETGKWVWRGTDEVEHRFDGPDVYTKDEIDTMFGSYIDALAELVGGGA